MTDIGSPTEAEPAETQIQAVEPVVAEGVTRSFGAVQALAGFDMVLPRGKVTALVGPNGAGKTTLLLILAGLLQAERGVVRVESFDPATSPLSVHATVGWMPDFFGVYDDLTATEYLELFAAAYGIATAERRARARELLALVRLESFADAKVHTMSRGQKQRLGFGRTLVHRPSVLLLDEPASGLDPRARIELRELVRAQASEGVTVLVSSHILAELEETADLVVFVDRGRSKGMYPLSALPAHGAARNWKIRALDADVLKRSLDGADLMISPLRDGGLVVGPLDEGGASELLARLVRDGVPVVSFGPQSGGLEDSFMSLDRSES